jgi:signal transduction histidine kinase
MSRRLAHLDAENRRLAESERLSELSEVARGLAHTLRNPLNALGLSVEELAARAAAAEPGASAGALDLADAARRQIRRIDASLRFFLALASAGAAAAERVDVASLAREVALEALQDGGGRVRIEVDSPAPAPITAVAAEVKAVLQALVVNAVEASPDGARVRLAVAPGGGGRAELEVEDEGPGLPAEVRRRLFSPHVTTKPHGSGMGLFLAHRIAVGRYGGALALEPGATGGTRARLVLADRRESDGGPSG